MPYVLTTLILALAAAADSGKGDPLAGTWNVVSMTVAGNENAQVKDNSATFADGKVTFRSTDGKDHAASYSVDTDRSPAAIDLKPEDGAQPGKPVKGIFAVDRDELKLCLGGKDGADRPTAFRSTDGNGAVLIVLKRAKGKSG